jgi:hypothetical protein
MNPVLAWIALGVATFGAFVFISALSYHLERRRKFDQPGNIAESRDNAIITGLASILIAAVLLAIAIAINR